MRLFTYSFFLILFISFSVSLFTSCSKSDSNPKQPTQPQATPSITSLSSTEGDYNSSVVITGTNFSSVLTDNHVFFNGVPATVTAATSTQLTATVPKDAGTGDVSVKIGTSTAKGPDFTYLGVLTIGSISNNHGPYTSIVAITGTGFSTIAANNQVLFNGKPAMVKNATTTQLTVSVPLSAGTGNVSVAVDNGVSISGPLFTYNQDYIVSTFVGSNQTGVVNGTGTGAILTSPTAITIDASDNLYIVEPASFLVRKITPDGLVSSYAGKAAVSTNNGTVSTVTLPFPESIAVDASGNVYVGDGSTNIITKITPAGITTVLAGNGIGSSNGMGTHASFSNPEGLAVDKSGNVYVADTYNNLIRKITPTGDVTTLAGSGQPGNANYIGTLASFSAPVGLAVDVNNNVYVADLNNHRIRKITPGGTVSNFGDDSFISPASLVFDTLGNLFVADAGGLIKKITPSGQVSTIAGGFETNTLQIDGAGTSANFYAPTGITIDSHNNLYVTDGNEVRKITFE